MTSPSCTIKRADALRFTMNQRDVSHATRRIGINNIALYERARACVCVIVSIVYVCVRRAHTKLRLRRPLRANHRHHRSSAARPSPNPARSPDSFHRPGVPISLRLVVLAESQYNTRTDTHTLRR